MEAKANSTSTALSHHNSRGRHANPPDIIDLNDEQPSVVSGRPTVSEFLKQTRDEMRIRFYRSTTIKGYLHAAGAFLRWLGHPPHRATRADVREYLLSLVESGADSGTVSNHLSAIRCYSTDSATATSRTA